MDRSSCSAVVRIAAADHLNLLHDYGAEVVHQGKNASLADVGVVKIDDGAIPVKECVRHRITPHRDDVNPIGPCSQLLAQKGKRYAPPGSNCIAR